MSISVITICFNNLSDLQKTCASVDAQTISPGEHWVINGSTQKEIEQWLMQSPQPKYRKWLNERDKGISDAFNKGIKNASHPIVHILNSGDCYAFNDVLEVVNDLFEKNPNTQWISGKIELIRAGKKVIVGKPFEKKKLYRGMRSIAHPTWFVRKAVYDRIGIFNLEYSIAMDYDLMCRIANEHYGYLDKVVVVFDENGISSENYLRSLEENKKVYESYFGKSFKLEIWQIRLKALYYLLQTPLGKGLFDLKKKLGFENW